jgi:hypothetical protein
MMKKNLSLMLLYLIVVLSLHIPAEGQTKTVKKGAKYDTIIVKHTSPSSKKAVPKPAAIQEIILPIPEYINQPYYYDKANNRLIKLESAAAQMITKKKSLGLKGAKQFLSMDDDASKIRFTAKKDIVFIIKNKW